MSYLIKFLNLWNVFGTAQRHQLQPCPVYSKINPSTYINPINNFQK